MGTQFVLALAMGISVVSLCSGCINNAAWNILLCFFGIFMAQALAVLECEGDVDCGDSSSGLPESFWAPSELPEGELIPSPGLRPLCPGGRVSR